MILKHKINLIVFAFLLALGFAETTFAQNYPIQITTQLAPPFSGFIPDYSTPGNQNLKLLVVFTDFTKPSYNIKLKLQITGQGITIQSKSYYYSGPITLQPGTPIEISGSDLSGLLNSANLDFSGINAQQYQTNALPEGYYNLCFTAYDFNNLTPIQVSNQSCAFGWMVLSDPPFLNLPFCESTISVNSPQNMMFQWTAMNMNSPNSANNTLYDFELYEVRPGSQSPGNIIQTLPPIYQTTTPFTFLNYGITEPQLYYGMQYVWRVRARDQSGRDLFKNQGYSQLCTFTYGNVLSQIDTNSLKLTLQGTALTYRLAKYTWDSLSIFLSYKLEYRKQGSSNWFPVNTTTCKSIVNNLEPENTYEARVKGVFSEGDGPWSNIVTITTPAKPVIVCGQGGIPPLASNFIPLKTGNLAQVWNIGQFDMLVTQLDNPNSPNGKYSGYGKIAIPFLANMNLNGKFSNITVNEAMEVVEGKVEITTTGIDAWVDGEDELNNESITEINGTIDTVIINSNGTIEITTTNGETITITNEASGTNHNQIINDSAGNSYILTPNGDIIFVPAGVNNIVKLSLQEISVESPNSLTTATNDLTISQQEINQINNLDNSTTNNNTQFGYNIIEEETDPNVSALQIQELNSASQKMLTYKQRLLLKSKWLVLKEFSKHYLNKNSYAEVAIYIITQNQSLKDELILKINQNESQQSMVTFAKDRISVFVEKIITDKINNQ
ncbi:MAG: fibronectin type III domain-containing protein [Bacteroidota bacterium]|nr:fibronectin type III domain-containing protein [Bacteroidota bacterium]